MAGSNDDATDRPITGPALEQASEAALKHTGEGRVTETEASDEEGSYEVEVTLDIGDDVDVHLDEDFSVCVGHRGRGRGRGRQRRLTGRAPGWAARELRVRQEPAQPSRSAR